MVVTFRGLEGIPHDLDKFADHSWCSQLATCNKVSDLEREAMAELPRSPLTEVLDEFRLLELTTQQIKYVVLLLGVPLNKLEDVEGARKDEKYVKALFDGKNANWGMVITALRQLGLKAKADSLQQRKNVTSAELPMSPLTHAFVLLSELTREQTRSLFLQLGVPYNDLDDIDADYRGVDRNVHYIQAWLDKENAPSPELIMAALHKIGKPVLAERIGTHLAKEQAVLEK